MMPDMARRHQHACRDCKRASDEILVITARGLCGECAIARAAATAAVTCGMIAPERFEEFRAGFAELFRDLSWGVVDSPGHKQWGVSRHLASSTSADEGETMSM